MCIQFEKNHIKKYRVSCGNFLFNIYTHMRNINLNAFENIHANPNIPKFEINIWIDKKNSISQFNCKYEKVVEYVPQKLMEFYNLLDSYSIPHIPMNKRINRFYNVHGLIHADFPYITDKFCLEYYPGKHEVWVVGDEITLERIIIDFLSVTAKIFPLHGSCIKIRDKTVLLLGESKSGKSSLVLKLMNMGAEFYSDDILFIYDNEVVRCGSFIGMRNEYLPLEMKRLTGGRRSQEYTYLNVYELASKHEYRLGNRSSVSEIFMISPIEYARLNLYQMFPMIPHESMWCADVLDYHMNFIERQIYESKEFYYSYLKNSKNIRVDFSNIDEFCNGLCNEVLG